MSESKDIQPIVRVVLPVVWGIGIIVLWHTGMLSLAVWIGILGGVVFAIRAVSRRIEASAQNFQEKDPLKLLERALNRYQYTQGFEAPGARAVAQLNQLQERRQTFLRVLGERLTRDELTYARYSAAVDQVAQGAIDALKAVLEELNSLASQNIAYTEDRVRALKALPAPSESDRSELETLQQRLAIRDEHLANVSKLLTDNERALTELDRTTSAISAMKVGDRLSPSDLDSALKDLEEIAARARKF